MIMHTMTFRGIVNVEKIYCDFFPVTFFLTTQHILAKFWPFYLRHQHIWHASMICTMKEEHRVYTDILFFVFDLDLLY
jgi:hypothetical protein